MLATSEQKENMKQRAIKLKRKGICVRCAKEPTIGNGVLCKSCNEKHVSFRRNQRKRVIEYYGGKCVCCGETNIKFLTLDHTNGDGFMDRKLMRGQHIEAWVERNEYPEGFQILCYNCNCGRQYNTDNPGICTHKEGLLCSL